MVFDNETKLKLLDLASKYGMSIMSDEAYYKQVSKDVKNKVRLYEEYLRQLLVRKKLINEVTVNEKEIVELYNNNEHYKKMNFEEVKVHIHQRLLRDKKANRVSEYIDELMKNIKIEKNLDILHEYYDNL